MKKSLLVAILIIIGIIIIGALAYIQLTGYAVKAPDVVSRVPYFQYTPVNQNLTKVYVQLYANSKDMALGISESIPQGFNVTSVSGNGVIKSDVIEWLFVPGIRTYITYSLQANSKIKNVSFSGNWYSDKTEGEITGTKFIKK